MSPADHKGFTQPQISHVFGQTRAVIIQINTRHHSNANESAADKLLWPRSKHTFWLNFLLRFYFCGLGQVRLVGDAVFMVLHVNLWPGSVSQHEATHFKAWEIILAINNTFFPSRVSIHKLTTPPQHSQCGMLPFWMNKHELCWPQSQATKCVNAYSCSFWAVVHFVTTC